MANTAIGAAAPFSLFSPAADQRSVSHLRITVQDIIPARDYLRLVVVSGELGFEVTVPHTPDRPPIYLGSVLVLEHPKGANPLLAPYTAIYPSHLKPSERKSPVSNITPFNFENNTIRVVPNKNGDPQFVAKDVAEALDYVWAGIRNVQHVPEEWRGVESVSTPSGKQEMHILSEQGLYFFLGRSDKPKALPMQKWIAGEVLPSIRKTGSYSTNGSTAKPEKPALPKPTREFKDYYSVAKLIGLDKNAAAIAANQAVMKLTGTNVLDLLGSTQLEAERQDTQWFTPTELGQRIGFSGRGFNQMLAEAGLQAKHEDVWEVSETGKQFSRMFDTGKKHGNGTPVTQVKWSPSVIEALERHKQAA